MHRIRTHLSEIVDAKHVMCDRTDLPRSQIEQGGEQNWRNPGDPPLWRWSCGMKKSRSLLAHVAELARDQHRREWS